MQTTVDTAQLKTLLKEAVTEVLEERHDLLQKAMEEALEDIGLANAIQAEEDSAFVAREQVFNALEGSA